MTAPSAGMKAIDIDCPACAAPKDVRCGDTLCRDRIAAAIKLTRDANAAARSGIVKPR